LRGRSRFASTKPLGPISMAWTGVSGDTTPEPDTKGAGHGKDGIMNAGYMGSTFAVEFRAVPEYAANGGRIVHQGLHARESSKQCSMHEPSTFPHFCGKECISLEIRRAQVVSHLLDNFGAQTWRQCCSVQSGGCSARHSGTQISDADSITNSYGEA
jgi:hypothetical protein